MHIFISSYRGREIPPFQHLNPLARFTPSQVCLLTLCFPRTDGPVHSFEFLTIIRNNIDKMFFLLCLEARLFHAYFQRVLTVGRGISLPHLNPLGRFAPSQVCILRCNFPHTSVFLYIYFEILTIIPINIDKIFHYA